jgi:UDP-N-acetylglucosamine--dolichyl-phosphate N-acetylglucosaminephosphotransferase
MPRLLNNKLIQVDVHKAGRPGVPEMGGLAILVAVPLVILTLSTVYRHEMPMVLSVVLGIGLIGLLDDVIGMRQSVKAVVPILAIAPLIGIVTGNTYVAVPFAVRVELGQWYLLIAAVILTVAPNALNMVGGFNGTELGMGVVVSGVLAVLAWLTGEELSLLLLLIALGASMAVLRYNWCTAKVFVGDVGAFTLGAVIAVAVIVGHLEVAGAILLIPFAVDLVMKMRYKLPKTFCKLGDDGKLYCPQKEPIGLAQLVLKTCGGLTEGGLALRLMIIEILFGAIAISVYALGGSL